MLGFLFSVLLVPQVFSPGVISGPAHDSAPAFTPDGRTVYFTRSSNAASVIVVSTRSAANWMQPSVAPFSGVWTDNEPAMAPDGSYLIFASNRPASADASPLANGANLWRVDRTTDGWSQPARLPAVVNSGPVEYSPSIAANGDLYFMRPDAVTKRFRLYVARPEGASYGTPQPLPFSDGSNTDVDPAVAPDESFMVFGSGRHKKTDIDLFIAFDRGGAWSEPLYLGDSINSPSSDAEPRLGIDRHTLYFASDRVVQVPQPIPPGGALAALADMVAWNNGLYNIWYVDIASILAPRSSANGDRKTSAL